MISEVSKVGQYHRAGKKFPYSIRSGITEIDTAGASTCIIISDTPARPLNCGSVTTGGFYLNSGEILKINRVQYILGGTWSGSETFYLYLSGTDPQFIASDFIASSEFPGVGNLVTVLDINPGLVIPHNEFNFVSAYRTSGFGSGTGTKMIRRIYYEVLTPIG